MCYVTKERLAGWHSRGIIKIYITDGHASAGNSGGPLLDSFGRLIGVNTATFTRQGTGRGSGVNFALPSDLVSRVVPRLIAFGSASQTVTGVDKRV